MKSKYAKPKFVCDSEGKATEVLLDIEQYQEMLEQLEDAEDLKILEERRKLPTTSRSFMAYLAERSQRV